MVDFKDTDRGFRLFHESPIDPLLCSSQELQTFHSLYVMTKFLHGNIVFMAIMPHVYSVVEENYQKLPANPRTHAKIPWKCAVYEF